MASVERPCRAWSLLVSILCTLGILVCALAVVVIGWLLAEDNSLTFLLPVCGLLVVPLGALTFAKFSAGVRRLHDRGKTGYWILLYYLFPCYTAQKMGLDVEGLTFVAITLGLIAWSIIDLGILRGDTGSNAFGPDPLAENR